MYKGRKHGFTKVAGIFFCLFEYCKKIVIARSFKTTAFSYSNRDGFQTLNVRNVSKSSGPCDSFLGEGKVGVRELCKQAFRAVIRLGLAAKPLPATAQATAPLPLGGSFDGYFHISNVLNFNPIAIRIWNRNPKSTNSMTHHLPKLYTFADCCYKLIAISC